MSFLRSFALAAAAELLVGNLAAPAAEMFPFVLPWDDASPGITNLSAWNEKPAGGAGFVVARGDHLFAGENRIRFFGVNMCYGGNFPTHEDAPKLAARMAKYGINCIRFHHMDSAPAPSGLLQKDKRTLDPDSLDKLDFFIAELKKQGIYANLNLHVGLDYSGFEKWPGVSSAFKGVDNFSTKMIGLQKEYARALLTHVNPYLGTAYVDEPAVAFIEINNENGLIMEWNGNALEAMPDPLAEEFSQQWNTWLKRKYGRHEKLAAVWNDGAEPLGEEMLKAAREAWNFELHEGAQATREYETEAQGGEAMHLKITQPGKEGWHAQIGQAGLKFSGGKTYTVRFRVKADAPRKISAVLSQAHAPWKALGTRDVSVTKDWQEIIWSVVVKEGDDQARFTFSNLGSAAGDLWLAGISLRPGGIVGVPKDEVLGGFDFCKKKEIGTRTRGVRRDWNEFLVETETNYWTGMRSFIRDELRAKSLVFGSAGGFSPWTVQSKLDVVDTHAYWQHPHFPRKQWDMQDWTVKNVPMAGVPNGGTLSDLALRRVAGKPFLVTEYNASSPNSYAAEAFLELCAVAGLQDWDGLFAFSYSHRRNDWDTKRFTGFFDIDQHPTKMATLPTALALFRRGDMVPPAPMAVAEVTAEGALDSIRTGSSWVEAGTYGIPTLEVFRRPIGMRIGPEKKWSAPPIEDTAVVKSANGEFTWDTKTKRMLVATSRSAGVVGAVAAGESIELGTVKIEPGATQQNWATITATVMEGDDFKSAKRILITATGMSENTDMKWKDETKTSVSTWGKAPSLVEGVPAKISLPAIKNAKAWSLDERGQRKAEVPLTQTDGGTQLQILPGHQTLWWEVSAE